MGVTEIFRTPDEAFANLPDFDYEPRYRESGELRLAYLDEGDPDGPPVVFWHGEPTWSFLWRKVFPAVRDAGFRCIVPDQPGFGRSDKPADLGWYSYDRFVEHAHTLLTDLDLRDATFVVHDWGGPVGLRTAMEAPDRVTRLAIMDTGVSTGHQRMSGAWRTFRDFVERTEDLPIGVLVQGATATELPDPVVAGYDAPFPSAGAKAGARAFPLLIPLSPDAPGAEAGQRTLAALQAFAGDVLLLWAEGDPVLPLETGRRFAAAIGRPEPEVIPGASHFLQEDQGELIGRRIAEWLSA
jgi:haloalkane dehalogenase